MSRPLRKNQKISNNNTQEKEIVAAAKTKQGFKIPVKNARATLKRILKYLAPYKFHLAVAMLFSLFSISTTVGGTFFLSVLIDDYILPLSINYSTALYNKFLVLLSIMAAMFLVGALVHYIVNKIMIFVTSKVLEKIRNQMFEHMQKLPIKYYDENTHGDLMSLYTNDTDTLRELLSNALPSVISSGIIVLSVLVFMLILSPLLTLFVVVMLVVMLFITGKFGGRIGKHFAKQQQMLGTMTGFSEEHIEGQRVIKVFNREEKAIGSFERVNSALFEASKTAHTYANILMPIMGNISYLNFSITAMVGALFALLKFGGMTLGKLASFLQYTRQVGMPIAQIAQMANTIFSALAGAERIFKFLDQKVESDSGYVSLINVEQSSGGFVETKERTGLWAWKHPHKELGTITYPKLLGEVEFDKVNFGYNEDKLVLFDIVLRARAGEKIALVGSTGAGKSTITNLINRFYNVQDGKIRFDGINIEKIRKEDLRKSLGMVLQDVHLFTATVRDNIRYGRLDATDEEVEDAAKIANAHQFIMQLPQGYDTLLKGDGSNLSQGQRQLLSIARAVVADPPVLVLDEATSSIDMRTERLIEKGMNSLMEGRTVFVIAHRLSTVRNADKIIVLEQGRIIEQGNHDQLIEQKGNYYNLYTGAFELD